MQSTRLAVLATLVLGAWPLPGATPVPTSIPAPTPIPSADASPALSIEGLLATVKENYYRPDIPNLDAELREGAARGLLERLNEIQDRTLAGLSASASTSSVPSAHSTATAPPSAPLSPSPAFPMPGFNPELKVNCLFGPAEHRLLKEELQGSFGGIGLRLHQISTSAGAQSGGAPSGTFEVLEPIPGMPADRAGLKKGDRIISVDGIKTDGLDLGSLVLKLRGPAGTTVKVGIERAGRTSQVSIQRETVKVPSVELATRPGGVAQLRIREFHEGTVDELRQALAKAISLKVWGIVLDLRDNPGGALDMAVNAAGLFLTPGQVIVRTQRRGEPEQVRKATAAPVFTGRVVVLVDPMTRCGAEIVTGALQDNRRALVVGERTYGKGTGETVLALPSGHALKLTTLVFFRPSGASPSVGGIEPDIALAPCPARRPSGDEPTAAGPDVSLDAAFKVLLFAKTP